jgi:hypothetical protein
MKFPAASNGVSGFRKSLTNFTASGGEFNPERLTLAATLAVQKLAQEE